MTRTIKLNAIKNNELTIISTIRLIRPCETSSSVLRYPAIHGCTKLYTAIQGYTQLYRAIHSYTGLYTAINSYTQL